MAQLMHQQPTNVKMAWLNPDNPLAFSVMKRTSKISKLGESLEIEAIDEFEGNLARASRRQNLTKVYAPSQAPSKYETSSTSPFKNEDDVFSNSDDENNNLEADEISLELKLYDQGPVYLMNLDSKSPTFRSRTRRSMRYRPSSRISSNDVDDNSPSNFDQSEDDDGDTCRDDSNDENFDEKDCHDRPETPSTQEPTYEMVPPICSMMPGQRLSTIYVKPAKACFDLTDVCPGIYSKSQT